MNKTNFKLTIEYNGKDFFGWQKQDQKRTVQGELENAFFKLLGQRVEVEGSGRTDKGVHALGQVASVCFENKIPFKNLKTALNNLLPPDILIKKIEKADNDFHARFSAKKKTYRYIAKVGQRSAINFDREGVYGYKVDLQKILYASKLLVGKHNFKGFACSDTTAKTFDREIYSIDIKQKNSTIIFDTCGNGFLYNMVRIIVGTLLDVGRGKLSCDDIEKALKTGDRKYSGITMPPNGLYLLKVDYQK